jgi:cell fate regulator YaaT (PSP1 superfamily)
MVFAIPGRTRLPGEPGAVRPQVPAMCYVRNSGPEFCRLRAGRIQRVATAQDLNEQKHLNAHVHEDISYCAERAATLGLDMKVVTAEHLLGGERIVFYFSAPGRVDFRQLVKELASQQYRTRIEMRQVGARDEARLVADYEVCGRECCCKNFLKKLRPVNMKMAKLQKSTLDPSKVSGRCGRLRCCLRYEHTGYEELAAKLPRPGRWVKTELGVGRVTDVQILTQLVQIEFQDRRVIVIPREEIEETDVPPPPPPEERERPAPRSRSRRGEDRRESPAGDDSSRDKRRGRRGRPRDAGKDEGAPGTDRPRRTRQKRRDDAPSTDPGVTDPPRSEDNAAQDDAQKPKRRRRRRNRRRKPPGDGDGSANSAGGDGGQSPDG